MSEDRYRVLQDAVAALIPKTGWDYILIPTLQAILNRHKPDSMAANWCEACDPDNRGEWPCPDVLTVETALRNMGAL